MAMLNETVNSMVDQLSTFASKVTRVALEVGTQGILGGQATVEGVQGTWADLTRNVKLLTEIIFDDSSENGQQPHKPSALHLRSYQGCRVW